MHLAYGREQKDGSKYTTMVLNGTFSLNLIRLVQHGLLYESRDMTQDQYSHLLLGVVESISYSHLVD